MPTLRLAPSTAICSVLAALGGLLLVLTSAAPASATAYRFWIYWTYSGGGWHFASTGPTRVPEDGAVEGWRFEISQESGGARPPRTSGSFEKICGGTAAVDGHKRVAVVVDYGVVADAPSGSAPPRSAPRGYCAVLSPSANGYRALAAGAGIRANDSGLVCAIDGYPARGCGDPVESRPAPTRSSAPSAKPSHPAPRATTVATRTAAAVASATPPSRGASPAARLPSPDEARVPGPTGAPSPKTSPTAAASSAAASAAGTPEPARTAGSAGTPEPSMALALGESARPVANGSTRPGGTLGLATGAAVVLLLGGAALLRARSRRNEP